MEKAINILMINNELKFGLTFENIKEYQVLLLPENFKTTENKEELIDASESLDFYKHLKEKQINCANSFELGLNISTLERRGGDIWIGQIFIIDSVIIPFLVSILSDYVQSWLSKSRTDKQIEMPTPQVHLELKMYKNGSINKLKYDGDNETLESILNSLKNGE